MAESNMDSNTNKIAWEVNVGSQSQYPHVTRINVPPPPPPPPPPPSLPPPATNSTPVVNSPLSSPNANNNNSNKKRTRLSSGPRTSWTKHLDITLLNALIQIKKEGYGADNGNFRSAGWREVTKAVASEAKRPISRSVCDNRWRRMKRVWKLWTLHKEQVPDWTWDNDLGTYVNRGDVTEKYFNEHPELRQFQGQGPEYRPFLEYLLDAPFDTSDWATDGCESDSQGTFSNNEDAVNESSNPASEPSRRRKRMPDYFESATEVRGRGDASRETSNNNKNGMNGRSSTLPRPKRRRKRMPIHVKWAMEFCERIETAGLNISRPERANRENSNDDEDAIDEHPNDVSESRRSSPQVLPDGQSDSLMESGDCDTNGLELANRETYNDNEDTMDAHSNDRSKPRPLHNQGPRQRHSPEDLPDNQRTGDSGNSNDNSGPRPLQNQEPRHRHPPEGLPDGQGTGDRNISGRGVADRETYNNSNVMSQNSNGHSEPRPIHNQEPRHWHPPEGFPGYQAAGAGAYNFGGHGTVNRETYNNNNNNNAVNGYSYSHSGPRPFYNQGPSHWHPPAGMSFAYNNNNAMNGNPNGYSEPRPFPNHEPTRHWYPPGALPGYQVAGAYNFAGPGNINRETYAYNNANAMNENPSNPPEPPRRFHNHSQEPMNNRPPLSLPEDQQQQPPGRPEAGGRGDSSTVRLAESINNFGNKLLQSTYMISNGLLSVTERATGCFISEVDDLLPLSWRVGGRVPFYRYAPMLMIFQHREQCEIYLALRQQPIEDRIQWLNSFLNTNTSWIR